MSRRKPNSKKPKRRKPFDAGSDSVQEKPAKSDGLDQKQHMNPVAAVIIVVLFVSVAGYAAWSYLGRDDKEKAKQTDTRDQDKSQTVAEPELPDWAKLPVSEKIWETQAKRSEQWNKIDDPLKDGWDTEVFNNQAGKFWTNFKKLITSTETVDEESLEGFYIENAGTNPVVPNDLETIFESDQITIHRANGLTNDDAQPWLVGRELVAANLEAMLKSFTDRKSLRLKIKVFRVEKEGQTISTQQSVEMLGKTDQGLKEINAIWKTTWQENSDELPLLATLKVTEFETAESKGNQLFQDVTESAVGKISSFQNQLSLSYDHWLDRSQGNRLYSLLGNPGLAIGDVNGDGLDDIYICQEDSLPNLLYIQQADGSLVDASRGSGVDFLQNSSSALILDLDSDGKNDIAVAVTGGVVLAKGDSTGKFKVQTVLDASDHVMSLSAVDYNLDGKLDIYSTAYYPDGIDRETEDIFTPDQSEDRAYGSADDDGSPNRLFENRSAEGTWSYSDVTDQVGLSENNTRLTFAASWEDFDNDGDQDLYVANDYGLNCLYRNDLSENGERRFTNVAKQYAAEDSAFGMSVAWGDYDRNGWMDLYVSNMFSYAGNRVTFQKKFQSDSTDFVRTGYQRFARGNTLLANPGGKPGTEFQFVDRSLADRVNRARWAWSSRFVDINNDGWEDLLVANGYITTSDSGDL